MKLVSMWSLEFLIQEKERMVASTSHCGLGRQGVNVLFSVYTFRRSVVQILLEGVLCRVFLRINKRRRLHRHSGCVLQVNVMAKRLNHPHRGKTCKCNVKMMIEIQDLDGVQERCPPQEDQQKKEWQQEQQAPRQLSAQKLQFFC